MDNSYSVVMFAHNEQENIVMSVNSVFSNSDNSLDTLCVLANGCTDDTVKILHDLQTKYSKLNVIELDIGDKCNAWNSYVHQYASNSTVHFFVDADVRFTPQAFPLMQQALTQNDEAWAIAGLPFSGRNIDKYKDMVTNKWCLFGNCYGLKLSFLTKIKSTGFKLPIGLGWIDSAITRIIYRDLEHDKKPIKGRVIYNDSCGYEFDSLSVFKLADWSLYINRITRYRLGKMQEKYLEKLAFQHWPKDLLSINEKILGDINKQVSWFNFRDKYLVARRIKKFMARIKQ